MRMPVFFEWVIGFAIATIALNILADVMAMQAGNEPAVMVYVALLSLIGVVWGQERNPDVRRPPGPIMRTALVLALLSMVVYGGARLVSYMGDGLDRQLNEQMAAIVFVTFLVGLIAYWLLGREPPSDDQTKVSKPKT